MIPLIASAAVPTFVTVIAFVAELMPTDTNPKLRLIGDSFTVVPIPFKVTFCGLPAALSLILKTEVRMPLEVGLNVTFTAQLALGANELPQVEV